MNFKGRLNNALKVLLQKGNTLDTVKNPIEEQTKIQIRQLEELPPVPEEIENVKRFLKVCNFTAPEEAFHFIQQFCETYFDTINNERKELLFTLRTSIVNLTRPEYFEFVEYLEKQDKEVANALINRVGTLAEIYIPGFSMEPPWETEEVGEKFASALEKDKRLIKNILVITNDDTIN